MGTFVGPWITNLILSCVQSINELMLYLSITVLYIYNNLQSKRKYCICSPSDWGWVRDAVGHWFHLMTTLPKTSKGCHE